jgi:hypothetical protein
VALALSLGRFHDIQFGVVVFANVAIYAGLAYLALTLLTNLNPSVGGGPEFSRGPLYSTSMIQPVVSTRTTHPDTRHFDLPLAPRTEHRDSGLPTSRNRDNS